jgi:hypothetical protein
MRPRLRPLRLRMRVPTVRAKAPIIGGQRTVGDRRKRSTRSRVAAGLRIFVPLLDVEVAEDDLAYLREELQKLRARRLLLKPEAYAKGLKEIFRLRKLCYARRRRALRRMHNDAEFASLFGFRPSPVADAE